MIPLQADAVVGTRLEMGDAQIGVEQQVRAVAREGVQRVNREGEWRAKDGLGASRLRRAESGAGVKCVSRRGLEHIVGR